MYPCSPVDILVDRTVHIFRLSQLCKLSLGSTAYCTTEVQGRTSFTTRLTKQKQMHGILKFVCARQLMSSLL